MTADELSRRFIECCDGEACCDCDRSDAPTYYVEEDVILCGDCIAEHDAKRQARDQDSLAETKRRGLAAHWAQWSADHGDIDPPHDYALD